MELYSDELYKRNINTVISIVKENNSILFYSILFYYNLVLLEQPNSLESNKTNIGKIKKNVV